MVFKRPYRFPLESDRDVGKLTGKIQFLYACLEFLFRQCHAEMNLVTRNVRVLAVRLKHDKLRLSRVRVTHTDGRRQRAFVLGKFRSALNARFAAWQVPNPKYRRSFSPGATCPHGSRWRTNILARFFFRGAAIPRVRVGDVTFLRSNRIYSNFSTAPARRGECTTVFFTRTRWETNRGATKTDATVTVDASFDEYVRNFRRNKRGYTMRVF